MATDSSSQFLTVLTTTDSQHLAERLARGAVEARLAACAQIDGPVRSVYRWQGEVQSEPEWRVLFKTTAARYEALAAYVRSEHDYDTPEIIATEVIRGDRDYLAWLAAEAGGEAR
jgi:periplasmic divalent cation tolerance protein